MNIGWLVTHNTLGRGVVVGTSRPGNEIDSVLVDFGGNVVKFSGAQVYALEI